LTVGRTPLYSKPTERKEERKTEDGKIEINK
jgi:hypothetical protein